MTPKLKSKLEEARETLARALAASTSGHKALAKLEADRDSVASRISQLETATERAPEDADGVAKLSTLREQQKLFDRKIALVQNEQQRGANGHERDLGEATYTAERLIIEAEQPQLKALTAQVTEALAPFFKDESKLEFSVMRTEMLQSFRGFLGNLAPGPLHEKPQRALVILDKILADGDCGWSWHTAPTRAATPSPATPATPPPPAPAAATSRTARRAQAVLA